MLKLTIKPGECLFIGDTVKVVITGGTHNNFHILVDAPKSMNIVRGSVIEKKLSPQEKNKLKKYYVDEPLKKEEINRYIASKERVL